MCCQESICNVNISYINSIPSEWKHYGHFHTVSSELFLKTLLASGTWYWNPFRVHSSICHPSFFMSTLLGFHLFNNSTKIFEASYVQQHCEPWKQKCWDTERCPEALSTEGTQMWSKGCGERNRTHAQETVQGRGGGGQPLGVGQGAKAMASKTSQRRGKPCWPERVNITEARAEIRNITEATAEIRNLTKVSFHLFLDLLQGSHMVTLMGVF